MSIEAMTFVNVLGDINFLNSCILKLINFKMFHLEKVKKSFKTTNFEDLNEQNPYHDDLNKIKKILEILNIKINKKNYEEIMNIEKKEDEFLNFAYEKLKTIEDEILNNENEINNLQSSLKLINHIKNLDSNLIDITKTQQLDIHFGKLPLDSFLKLDSFKDEDFFFIPQDKDENFCWGFYVTSKIKSNEIFELFKDLYFTEYYIPKDAKDKPKQEIEKINSRIEDLENKLANLKSEKEKFKMENLNKIEETYCKIKTLSDTFNYRKFAKTNKKQFILCGFIPTKKIHEFEEIFKNDEKIVFEFLNENENSSYSPPVKLKTSRLFRPFEMYVTTYGTPQYGSINPSSLIGFIYSLVFGVMFGDLGQGFLLFVGGIFAWKKNKNNLGLILTRCGFFSMIFGLVFDSIFGFEGILVEFWKNLGFSNILPFHLLKPSNSIPILVASCLLGMVLILISISINIFLNLKNKNLGEALFSHNGLAGLTCYGGCTVAVLFLLFSKKNIFSPIFLLLIVGLPLFLIFFSLPLSNIVNSKKSKEKFSVSSAIFDMIDILLSYFTNTLSFLRIGGLALSHAALMLVVMKFAKMAGAISFVGVVGGPLVIVLGNAFVVMLEGLIVSIQALRLIYYEIFSRFYISNGKPFNPIKINLEN